ncbi:hypothetical protein Pla100_63040 [Neorhodopirellula pilleata]|uniref:Uncharacterized protein n=1 Tax=Neorhodopirellula pilleata TaxID=2714738 RepID=A0A5C5YVP9_9BACT|nr:hypothetical protein Pla100_63040 [Neorhodopirellula pilleata]
MPRPPRADVASEIYHALNRANGRMKIFHKSVRRLTPGSGWRRLTPGSGWVFGFRESLGSRTDATKSSRSSGTIRFGISGEIV